MSIDRRKRYSSTEAQHHESDCWLRTPAYSRRGANRVWGVCLQQQLCIVQRLGFGELGLDLLDDAVASDPNTAGGVSESVSCCTAH